jgi:hypothetical protein
MENVNFPLYHGRNDTQEFWSTPHTPSIVLIRLLREDDWSVNRKTKNGYTFMFYADSAEEGARRAGVKLDTTKIWMRNDKQQYLKDVKGQR